MVSKPRTRRPARPGPAPAPPGFTVFATAIGSCAIAWSEHGVTALQLPSASAAATAARLLRRCPGAHQRRPPASVTQAIDAIRALLVGEARDLTHIGLDWQGLSPFERQVYAAARALGPGATCTYGELAARVGRPGAARAVGGAMGRNPFPLIVPCHRVLAAGGRAGGFSAPGGVSTKRRLLQIEGVARPA